jgi:hypothetical protein
MRGMRSVLSITSTVVSSHDHSSVTSLGTIDDEDSTLSQETSPPLGWKDTFRETSARSNSIYQAPSTPLTITLAPYQSPKGKNRSENQRSQQKIPLELPRITGHISGNPRHLVSPFPYSTSNLSLPLSLSLFRQVNLIHLHPKDEKLRDTIFYQIFQNSLLLDKETDAVIYRNLLIQNKIFPIPNLYSLDGVCLRGDGLFHPTQDRLPGKLNYIFGEKSVTDLSEFRNLDRELNLIQEIKSFLQQENEICLQKSQRENAINELHEEIERIENRHGMKRRKRIRKASELMYEEMHEEEEEEREGEEGCSLSQHNRKKRTHK